MSQNLTFAFKMPNPNRHATTEKLVVPAAYYGVLVLFLVASFFPEYRVWGINWWAYFPGYVPFVLFAVGAVAPIVIRVTRRHESDVGDMGASADRSRTYFIIVFCLIVLYGLAFYLLRARTHFLGDGYTVLSLLAADNPLVKPRELGEALVHIWVKSFIGGEGESAALLSFQIISISAGVLFLIAVALFARFLFERTKERILFLLGLASSGCMLLFFGYVENYSLFVLSVAVYSLMGLLVVKGKINRWLTLPSVALPIFFHIIGVSLIPSAIYLLLANSKLGDYLHQLNWKTKLLAGLLTAGIAASIFYHYYSADYILRIALVPFFEDRFTVENYTMFSLKHMLDYLNLLILLLPGLPLLVVTLHFLPMRDIFRQREYRYLLILLASTLGAVFIFDPKLGMPRDWDLFSFAGVPLGVFSYYFLIYACPKSRYGAKIGLLSVLLGFLSLLPRAGSQSIESISVAHLKSYIDLDKGRSLPVRYVLLNYYKELGKQDKAALLKHQWRGELQENNMLVKSLSLLRERQLQEAILLLRQLLERNPGMAGAWARLGECYMLLGGYDSALTFLRISEGMNPYNLVLQYNLGFTYYSKKEHKKAEKHYLKAVQMDSLFLKPLLGLAFVYAALDQRDKYIDVLLRIGSFDDAPAEALQKLGNYYFMEGEYRMAAEAYERALKAGMDSSYYEELIEKYPELKE